MPVALITGSSRGFGRAVATTLADVGWDLIVDARGAEGLTALASSLGSSVIALPGDVSDDRHRRELLNAVDKVGRLDLLLNNASTLGPTPLPLLSQLDPGDFLSILVTNAAAPLALAQAFLERLRQTAGVLINISSDAAVEPYPGWGGYGASKAALDQLTAVLAAENPDVAIYALDPGDMRTDMHQAAFPGEDISDRPDPKDVVPAILWLLASRPPSGRYRASDLLVRETS